MTTCDNCGKQARTVVPVMSDATRYRVLDDIMNTNRPLPRSALTTEQNAAIPWGTHPDDDQFQSWCVDCTQQEIRRKAAARRPDPRRPDPTKIRAHRPESTNLHLSLRERLWRRRANRREQRRKARQLAAHAHIWRIDPTVDAVVDTAPPQYALICECGATTYGPDSMLRPEPTEPGDRL